MANCTHPAICNGICLVCGVLVDGKNGANSAVVPQDGQTPIEAGTPPETGQETPKKTTRKRKA